MVEFAERNGRSWIDDEEDRTVEMMIAAAAGTVTEAVFSRWVSERLP